MGIDSVAELGSRAIYMTLLISLPMLAVALLVGLLISIFQAVTQIQEMTLTFVPKIIAVFLVMIFAAPWLTRTIVEYTIGLFRQIPGLTS